jgi:hypothetical protein
LAKAFLRSARLDREESDPVARLARDGARTGVVMRARVGAHLGMKGAHDRTWRWRYEDEQRCGVAGAATRHGVAGCPCCVRPDDESAVCRRCHGWSGRGRRGVLCGDCGCGGDGGAIEGGDVTRLFETVAERLRKEAAWRDADEAASHGKQLETRLATLRHLWFAECAEQPHVEETAADMLEKAARVVVAAGARDSALHDALGDAARAMAGTAADRAARSQADFEHVRRN